MQLQSTRTLRPFFAGTFARRCGPTPSRLRESATGSGPRDRDGQAIALLFSPPVVETPGGLPHQHQPPSTDTLVLRMVRQRGFGMLPRIERRSAVLEGQDGFVRRELDFRIDGGR